MSLERHIRSRWKRDGHYVIKSIARDFVHFSLSVPRSLTLRSFTIRRQVIVYAPTSMARAFIETTCPFAFVSRCEREQSGNERQ